MPPLAAADLPQLAGREHVAPAVLTAGDALELPQFFERIDADVRIRADAQRDPPVSDPDRRQEAVPEVRLRRGARTNRGAAVAEQIELDAVGMGRVDDRGPLAEAAAVREQLDRPKPVLGDALLELARLLVGVHVERKGLLARVAPELLEPVAGARADGVRGDRDRKPSLSEALELVEIRGDGLLAHARQPATRVGRVDAYEDDPCLLRRLCGGEGRLGAEVVELAHRREPRGPHLAVRPGVERTHRGLRLTTRLVEHALPPRPEVAIGGATPERALEGVAVRVHEPGQADRSRHARPH